MSGAKKAALLAGCALAGLIAWRVWRAQARTSVDLRIGPAKPRTRPTNTTTRDHR